MTEPTDAELDAVLCNHWPAFSMQATLVMMWVRAAMRDALTQWGTPPAVAGEPIGYLYCGGSYGDELADWEIVADQHQCDKLNEHHGALGKEAKLPLHTTPQPTQAQAGAVPTRAFLERTLAAMEGVIDVADRKTDEFDALRSCVIDLTLMLFSDAKRHTKGA